MRSPSIWRSVHPGCQPTGCVLLCCATCGSASIMPSPWLTARTKRWSSTIRARRYSRRTVFFTISPTIPSASRDGGSIAGRTLATPSPDRMRHSTEGELHQQKKTVEAEERRQSRDATAKPEKSARSAEDADRAQDDRDLKESTAVIEAEVPALRQIALLLEAARLGQQLLLAGAVHRLALEVLDARVV